MIQSVSKNHLEGYEKEYINYSFSGQPTRKQIVHTPNNGSSTITQTYRYFYDHADRKRITKYKINDMPEVILSELVYDELGRVSKKKLLNESSAFTQTIDYKYNIRNWLKSISSQSFKETLYYNDPMLGVASFATLS